MIANAWSMRVKPLTFGDTAEKRRAEDLEQLIDYFQSSDMDYIDQVDLGYVMMESVITKDADIRRNRRLRPAR